MISVGIRSDVGADDYHLNRMKDIFLKMNRDIIKNGHIFN